MKTFRYISVIGFLLLNNILSSQILVKENRLWSNSMYGTEKEYFWQNSNWIKFEGDTLINDTIYKVIYRSEDEFHENWYQYGAIREDSTKKVFIHQNNNRHLLYDFNLDVGDSIMDYYGYMYLYVTKVDSIELEYYDKPLKRIYFSCRKDEDPRIFGPWIEGIGSLEGILSGTKNMCTVGAVYDLVCFSENDTLKYRNSYHTSCFPQGYYDGINKEEIKENLIKVCYSNEYVFLKFRKPMQSSGKLVLYGITGKQEESFDVDRNELIQIPIEKFAPGFYIYFYKDNEYSETGKIIIDR